MFNSEVGRRATSLSITFKSPCSYLLELQKYYGSLYSWMDKIKYVYQCFLKCVILSNLLDYLRNLGFLSNLVISPYHFLWCLERPSQQQKCLICHSTVGFFDSFWGISTELVQLELGNLITPAQPDTADSKAPQHAYGK